MPDVPTVGDLQIERDLPYQRREWVIERIGWAGLLIIILAALVGLLGRGPISRTTQVNADQTVRLGYARFARYGERCPLRLEIVEDAAKRNEITVTINQEYLNGLKLVRVSPSPIREEPSFDTQVFVFSSAGSSGPITITFDVEPEKLGLRSGEITVAGRPKLSFTQYVYP